MGRVLPSGRVFGEAVGLPNIDYAAREKFGGRLGEVIESPVTDLAVAGISRIADELDYRDRLGAEKQKVAAADIEERKAKAALTALQEQMEARGAAMAAAKERSASAEAQSLAAEQADIAGIQQGEAIDVVRGVVQQIAPGGPHPPFLARGMDPGQQLLAGLAQAEDPEAYYAAWKSGYDPSLTAFRGTPEYGPAGSGEALLSPWASGSGSIAPAQPIPEKVTEDQLDAARARMIAAQKASAIPMAFVPRTLADYRFQVRELERALVSAETQEEKAAIIDQLRNTMETARGAVDVQPDGLIEAFTGEAGKGAQKTVLKDMGIAEKEFLKQMYAASKEERDVAREGRDVAREGRAVAKEAHEAEMRPLRVKQIKAQVKKLKKKARGSRRAGKVDDAIGYALIAATAGNIDDYKGKTGAFSDDAIQKEAGMSLSPEETESRRQQKWRSITTAPDGRSMSDADHTNLSAMAGALGFSKSIVSEARSTQGKMHSRVAASVRSEERKDAVEKRVRQRAAERGLPYSLRTRTIKNQGYLAYTKAIHEGATEEEAWVISAEEELHRMALMKVAESLPPGTADVIEAGAGRPARADEYVITEIMEQP